MNTVWTILLFSILAIVGIAAEPPASPAQTKKPSSLPDLDIVNRLREGLKSGTPAEKETALNLIRDLKPIKLIPEVIEAIEDPTPLPAPASRDCKASWGFVGHQAASVMAEMARDIDGISVGMKPGDRAYQSYSFHNDLDQGEKLKAAGRLSEVRNNWAKWWDAARK